MDAARPSVHQAAGSQVAAAADGKPPVDLLLIDDSPEVRDLIITTAAISHPWLKIDGVGDGRSAEIVLSQRSPDLIVLDLALPDIDGIDLLQRIKRQTAAPVIILSARDDTPSVVHALEVGADDYVSKPIPVAELLAHIAAAARRLDRDRTAAAAASHKWFKISAVAVAILIAAVLPIVLWPDSESTPLTAPPVQISPPSEQVSTPVSVAVPGETLGSEAPSQPIDRPQSVAVPSSPSTVKSLEFSSFESSSRITLNGAAVIRDGALLVTPSRLESIGAVWLVDKFDVSSGFVANFTFRIANKIGIGADGFAFVIQGQSTRVLSGTAGPSIGYGALNGAGIRNSLAVEFDTWRNAEHGDPESPHIAIHSNGALPNEFSDSAVLAASETARRFDDGAVHSVSVQYDGAILKVLLDGDPEPVVAILIQIPGYLGLKDGTAWLGFTASTGGAAQAHEILSLSVTTTP